MSKVLIISGHTDLNQSIVNKAIIANVEAELAGQVEVRRLSEIAPEWKFDVKAEQDALVAADVVVLQFPVFWYNAPSLLRKWLEDVWTYGFAYGHDVKTFHGKKLIISATAGAQEQVYKEVLPHTLEQAFIPFINSAVFTGIEYLAPVLSYGALNNPTVNSDENAKHLDSLAADHSARLIAAIKSAL